MLTITDLCVSYGRFKAIDGVNIEVAGAGQLHGVIGPNGAGKTTLMDAISGRNPPTSGRVVFKGQDVTRRSVQWRRLHGMSRSFQRTSIFPSLSVAAQIELVASHLSADDAPDVMKTMRIGDLLDKRASQISYGDQRRVDIALALLGRPQMILLDEPAAGLSTDETLALFRHLSSHVKQQGVTAMVVEHDVEAVFGFCDVITVLDLGKMLVTADPLAVRSDKRVIAAYLGSAA